MKIFPIKTSIIRPGQNLAEIILEAIHGQGLELQDGDIIAVASKAVSTATNRIINLKEIKPSRKALELASKYSLEPEFVELIMRESEKIYGGLKGQF